MVTCDRGRCCVDRCLDCLEVGQEPQTVKALENKKITCGMINIIQSSYVGDNPDGRRSIPINAKVSTKTECGRLQATEFEKNQGLRPLGE